jgi:hypothetical protein
MRDDTVRDNAMRDNTIPEEGVRDDPAGFEAPRTDQIPAATQHPGFADPRTDPADPRSGQPAAEPGYAEPGYAEPATDPGVPQATGEPGFADAAPVPNRTDPVATADSPANSTEDSGEVLFGGDDVERFRDQWRDLQAGFVDNPTEAVRGADQLVDEVLRKLTEVFAAHKQELETQWQGGETEELRVALRRYRSFFDQLLNA